MNQVVNGREKCVVVSGYGSGLVFPVVHENEELGRKYNRLMRKGCGRCIARFCLLSFPTMSLAAWLEHRFPAMRLFILPPFFVISFSFMFITMYLFEKEVFPEKGRGRHRRLIDRASRRSKWALLWLGAILGAIVGAPVGKLFDVLVRFLFG